MKYLIIILLVVFVSNPLHSGANDVVPGDVFAAINLKDMKAVADMLENDTDAVLAARTTEGITPLHYAARLNATEAVYRLLKAGVEVNIQTDGSLTTPLHWAANQGSSDTLRLLLKMGADVHAKAVNGYTALHFLARGAVDPEIARYLLEAEADIDAIDLRGNTPLHIAAANGNVAAVTYFIKAGARTNLKNRADKLAIEIAKDEATQLAFKSIKPPKTVAVVTPPTTQPPLASSPDLPIPSNVTESPPELVTQAHRERTTETNGITRSENILAVGEEYRKFMNDPDAIQNPDGSVYKGELRDGDYHGYGTLCHANRERYQGEWRKGLRHGVGTFTYSNGDIYNGGWRNHVPHGGGVFLYANGGKVNGSWKQGALVDGDGFYVSADGSKFRGVWRERKLVDSQPMGTSFNTP